MALCAFLWPFPFHPFDFDVVSCSRKDTKIRRKTGAFTRLTRIYLLHLGNLTGWAGWRIMRLRSKKVIDSIYVPIMECAREPRAITYSSLPAADCRTPRSRASCRQDDA